MTKYKLDKISEEYPRYNLCFEKETKKRNGSISIDYGDKIYSLCLEEAINLIAHKTTQDNFKDEDVTLKQYLIEYYKNWNNANSRT